MTARDIRVVPAQGKWQVRSGERVEGEFSTSVEAEIYARKRAGEIAADVLLFGRDGRFTRRESYGEKLA